jgi:predicted short-subunit dehydrogenase-like oxidoreductase (DUF2520 family)
METVQRLSYIHTTVDHLRLRYVYRKLRDLALPRSQSLLRLLAQGPMCVTDIERALYHDGDEYISQTQVSITIDILLRYDLIMRVYPPGESRVKNFYALRHANIRKIQTALDRFNGRLPPE